MKGPCFVSSYHGVKVVTLSEVGTLFISNRKTPRISFSARTTSDARGCLQPYHPERARSHLMSGAALFFFPFPQQIFYTFSKSG